MRAMVRAGGWASSRAARAVSGVSSAGLMTTVQPAARAGAKVVDFNAALMSAYVGMAEDIVMLRKRRGEMRKKMMMAKPA